MEYERENLEAGKEKKEVNGETQEAIHTLRTVFALG